MNSSIIKSKYPAKVFFLGSGASTLAGVPTFSDFRMKSESVYENIPTEDIENRFLFQRMFQYWNAFKYYNIEQLYAALEMKEMLDIGQKDITTDDLKRFIALTIQKSHLTNVVRPYRFFLQAMGQSMAIITTNWDLIFENIYTSLHENHFINYHDIHPYDANLKKGLPIILKLHGSLNWGYCEKCKQIFYFDNIDKEFVDPNEMECLGKKCNKNKLKLFIVPPTLSKLEKAEIKIPSPYSQLRSIWSKASEYIKNCKQIYFIGYSFPETDIQMSIFISNALEENKKLENIYVFSDKKHGKSKVDFEERYLSILSRFIRPSKIDFCYEGVEYFTVRKEDKQ